MVFTFMFIPWQSVSYLIPSLDHYQSIVHFSGMWFSLHDIMRLGAHTFPLRGLQQQDPERLLHLPLMPATHSLSTAEVVNVSCAKKMSKHG